MIVYYTEDKHMIYQVAYMDLPTSYDFSWWYVPGTMKGD